jgi:hypothetical protein
MIGGFMVTPSIQRLQLPPDAAQDLGPLFQQGIRVEIETGCTVKALLMEQWGLPQDYVMGRISTLFLNGKPVDDMEAAIVRDGAVLALSSAMPGLVGAVMRRGGYYASLRGGITYHETAAGASRRSGTITVKLFNLLIRELGPAFLAQGFRVRCRDLPDGISPPGGWACAPDDDILLISPPPSSRPSRRHP